MVDRNRCLESGCGGLCCQNVDLEITEAERKELFPRAVKVFSIQKLRKIKRSEIGLFYVANYQRPGLEHPDFNLLAINGVCPNRTDGGTCLVHKNREHAARNFRFGDDECNSIRKENGLGLIYLEPVD